MLPTNLNPPTQNQGEDSPRFGFIGEHVQWLRRTWNEGGVGTKLGLVCLIAGECLLGIATVFGLPVVGIAFYELHRQNSIPLTDRNVAVLNPKSTPQISNVNSIVVDQLKDPLQESEKVSKGSPKEPEKVSSPEQQKKILPAKPSFQPPVGGSSSSKGRRRTFFASRTAFG